ncbi:J domain-containing protein, partial [Streptomyces sp. NPDC052687]|uniref:J domain-containing protein n=1 Tax=Streptomyces sp. NPDC052687 TaxID=3154759 RepID=UPI00342D7CBA
MPGKRPPRDHYAVLGVPRSASAREITVAYRRLVRALHPDTAPRDPAVPDDLAAVLAAYDTLRDPGRRAA